VNAGGCVYKGFNRAIATASAAVIALGVHWIASKSGDKFEPFIRSGSVFLLGTKPIQAYCYMQARIYACNDMI
jgi:hypothetical protein